MPASRPARRVFAVAAAVVIVLSACGGAARVLEEELPTTEPRPTTQPPNTTIPGTSAPPPTTVAPDTTITAAAGYRWRVGDCFDFGRANDLSELPYAPYGDDSLVPCESAHTHEVYFVDVHPEGAEASYPPGFDERVEAACSRGFLDAFGLLWPDSTYSIIRYLPDEQEWADGERYLACVAFRPGPGRTVDRVAGSAVDGDLTWETAIGACYRADLSALRQAPTVDCDDRHVFEVIADESDPAPPGSPYPGDDELGTAMEAICEERLEAYLGSVAGPVASFPLRFSAAEWDLGYRRIVCIAVATDVGDVFEVTGSFSGEWEVVGVVDDDVVTA